MLEDDYQEWLKKLLAGMCSGVQLPEGWAEARTGDRSHTLVPDDRRRFQRTVLRGEAICELIPSLPTVDRTRTLLKVHTKDLSRSGVAFFTAMQLYPNETIALWTTGGRLQGKVARCTKRNDSCFEVAAAF